jgi:hypothetical protein
MAGLTLDQILAQRPGTGATLASTDIIISQDVSQARTEGYTVAEFIIGLYLLGGFATNADLVAHVQDTLAAHTAAAISVDSTSVVGTGTDLQTVLQDLTAAISAAGIAATIFDAAGDLIVATGADTAARLAIGAANTVLSSNASAALAWQAPRAIPKATVADTSTAYTAVLTDAGKQTTLSNAASITYTIPPNASVAFAVGTEIEIVQIGAGNVTVAAGAGVTIVQPPSMTLVMVGQYSSALATKTATNTWRVEGDFVTRTRTVVQLQVSDPGGSAISTGDGKYFFRVPATLSGYDLVAVAAHVSTVSSSGIPTVQLRNVTDSVDMLSTKLTIDASEKDSSTAATPAVIDTTKDDVATADEIAIDIDVAGTGAKGLIVELTFG